MTHQRPHIRKNKRGLRFKAGKKRMWERGGIVYDPNIEEDIFAPDYGEVKEHKRRYMHQGRTKRREYRGK